MRQFTIQGNTVMENFQTVAMIQGDQILDANWQTLLTVQGDRLIDGTFRDVATIQGDQIMGTNFQPIGTLADATSQFPDVDPRIAAGLFLLAGKI